MWVTRETRNRSLVGPVGWMGTLIDGMRDLSGQMYMRNRYYDPRSGRFTQEDPIGLAGGLNVYGFANGDPASYGDPYGLSSDETCPPYLSGRGDRRLYIWGGSPAPEKLGRGPADDSGLGGRSRA